MWKRLANSFTLGRGSDNSHRAFGPHETALLRKTAAGRKGARRGSEVPHDQNPGARLIPSFCSPEEGVAAVAEAKDIISEYGSSHVTDQHRSFYEAQMTYAPAPAPRPLRELCTDARARTPRSSRVHTHVYAHILLGTWPTLPR